jgi:hypothetical protein
MDLVVIPEDVAEAAGAKCLDGSPPAFYYRAANVSADPSAVTKFVLYFKGGGWCFNESLCAARAGGIIGSSAKLNKSQPTFSSLGPLDAVAAQNPEFANWHHVELWYCDGGSFSGDRTDPVTVDGKQVWFRGRRNLDTILDFLGAEKFGDLSSATDVLLSGGSAGGLSSFLHADYIHARFDKSKSTVKFGVAPISGFFLKHGEGRALRLAHTGVMSASVHHLICPNPSSVARHGPPAPRPTAPLPCRHRDGGA